VQEISDRDPKKESDLGSTASKLLAWLGGVIVAGLNVAISVVAARLLFAAQSGFGEGGFGAILFWTVPFATLLGLVFGVFVRRFVASSLPRRFAIGLLVGFAGAGAWTIFVAFLFGPMYGAFSIAPGRVWLVAGPSSVVAGVALLTIAEAISGFSRSPLVLLASFMLPFVVVFLLFQALVYGRGLGPITSPNVTFVAVKWEPDDGDLRISDPLQALTASEKAQLGALELWGRLLIDEISSTGTTARSETVRVIVVMHEPITEMTRLPVPWRQDVIYLQDLSGEWKQFPSDFARSNTDIRVEPRGFQGNPAVQFWLELNSSLESVGFLIWSED
jgi:hypothetical protein